MSDQWKIKGQWIWGENAFGALRTVVGPELLVADCGRGTDAGKAGGYNSVGIGGWDGLLLSLVRRESADQGSCFGSRVEAYVHDAV